MGWFKKDTIEENYQKWQDNYLEQEKISQQGALKRREKEEKLKLLEISSNCAIAGEPSSRTIERAVAFEKYLLS